MRTWSVLFLVLGAWLGGSLLVGAAAAYNFGGLDDLFERNPKLAERAGFDPDQEAAKKTSLIWVHASELNRVMFERWNHMQLVLGSLAVALALAVRARPLPMLLLLLTLALVASAHFLVGEPLEALGRQLDFTPRTPPPAALEPFQQLHGLYFTLEAIRFGALAAATLVLLFAASRRT